PGRLLDLAEKKRLNFKECGFLVIDEADRLFDMGFLPDLRDIVRQMPDRARRQSMLFSATLNKLSRRVA
ncbi:MAG: DEAD/DEAH box helicase, partial [Candidatus Aminicenantes bacterium]|nr:DEAD/DEAH box helicase [Candidatus Aminicenantes bacterium]